MANRDSSEKIGLRPLLIYAQAQTGLNLCVTLIGLHLLYLYTDRHGLSPSLAGLAFFLALVLDALTDPIVGNISDRARFKSGRRRPFFFASIPMAVCYYLLLSPPRLHAGLFVWFFGFYFLMLTSRKFYETAYGALMPELTLDYDERTKLSTFRILLGTVGDISGALLPFAASYLFARGTDFKVTGAVCGLIVAGGAMLAYAGLRERAEFSTLERSQAVRVDQIDRGQSAVLDSVARHHARHHGDQHPDRPAALPREVLVPRRERGGAMADRVLRRLGHLVSVLVQDHRQVRKEAGLRHRDDLQRDVLAGVHADDAPKHLAALFSDGVQRILGDRNLGHANVGVG